MMRDMVAAIVYDLDDTMVNSVTLHVIAWKKLLNKYGYEYENLPSQLTNSFIGMRIIDILKEIIKHFGIEEDEHKLYKKRTEIFLDLVKKELEPMPGLLESIKRFEAASYRLALASSGAKSYIELVLNKFGIKEYFEVIVSGDDVKVGKPHPETYLITSKKLSLTPSQCLVLEDATKGIQSAKAAGCKCIAIENSNTPAQDFSKADLVVKDLNQISVATVRNLNK